MSVAKQEIINQLKKDILLLQGFRSPLAGSMDIIGPQCIQSAFPNQFFPIGAVHEFLSNGAEGAAASNGFIAGLMGQMMKDNGVCVWLGTSRNLFPPALKAFGVAPERVIFIDLAREKEALWVMEETLKCPGFVAVAGELQDISFTTSRRLQLAVEKSGVTGFIIRKESRHINTLASVARWRISPAVSELPAGMPGVGFPGWRVELLKVRNGYPGAWNIVWSGGRFTTMVTDQADAVPLLPVISSKAG